METGKALKIVHGMATRLYKRHGQLDPATNPAEAQDALDTVEDFIVNNFEHNALVRKPVTWVDARGQVVYVKGSRKNKTERLTAAELEATKDLLSGTVTRVDGKVFYAPFHLANNKRR